MEYFKNRQHSIDLPTEELETAFKAITDHFSHKWLTNSEGLHPIQILWRRGDTVSTNELCTLGIALQRMSSISQSWVNGLIKKIKTGSDRERQGALFEIIGLSMFSYQDQKIVPAKANNPGYDGILELSNGKQMRISMKNYGISEHNKAFQKEARRICKLLKEKMVQRGMSLTIIADTAMGHPEKSDWQKLEDCLDILLDYYGTDKELPIYAIGNFWAVITHKINGYDDLLHPCVSSYSIIIKSPYHKNEEKNLYDKLDDACNNLVKHSHLETDDIINSVFVHLPDSASIIECKKWVESYYENFPDKQISGVILYQPTVANDIKTNTHVIHNCFQLVFKDKNIDNWASGKSVNLHVPIGFITNVPSQQLLFIDYPDKSTSINLYGNYIFQKGDYYLKMKPNAEGKMQGDINKLGSGFYTHLVTPPDSKGHQKIYSQKSMHDDKLLIL